LWAQFLTRLLALWRCSSRRRLQTPAAYLRHVAVALLTKPRLASPPLLHREGELNTVCTTCTRRWPAAPNSYQKTNPGKETLTATRCTLARADRLVATSASAVPMAGASTLRQTYKQTLKARALHTRVH